MPSTIAQGTFVLHSSAIPDLPAGSYTVRASQQFDAPGATTTTFDSHIEVTAPRFTLPRDQILSTFPPNKSQGAYSSRLPQIVLKRRTLPWERELDGKLAAGKLPREIPWLALILLADGEGEFLSAKPIAQCITAGVVLEGPNDTAIGDAIEVTQTVIDKIFPTKEDLPLLTHVREVDLSDTELAMGDDDGWLAVLLCNRLPQSGVRYRACLISLEGQYDRLPDTAEVEPHPPDAFVSPFVYPPTANLEFIGAAEVATGGRAVSIADGWSKGARAGKAARTKQTHRVERQATLATLGAMHRPGLFDAMGVIDARYRFPVLANWQFACTDDLDFQGLMQRLNVGLLDTVLGPPVVKVGEKPPPPRTRPEPEVIDTGHIVLAHTTRTGEDETVWYRGPLVPHPGGRDAPDADGKLPFLHSSDQAKRIGPDGRENLSLAAAFEIGRLLALAEPRVVAAFLNWRKEGFERARRIELADVDAQLRRVDITRVMEGFAARLGNQLLLDLGKNDAVRLGNPRPLVDGGSPIAGIDGLDVTQLIATGFGLPIDAVRRLIDPGATLGGGLTVPVDDRPADLNTIATNPSRDLGQLRDIARGTVIDIATDVLANRAGGPGGAPRPDALDGLLGGG